LAQTWVDRIDHFFNPPRDGEIAGKCPACDETHAYRTKDGETVQSAALSFVRDEEGNSKAARCAACGTQWLPSQFDWLLSTLAKDDAAANSKPIPTIVPPASYCIGCYQDGHTDYINL